MRRDGAKPDPSLLQGAAEDANGMIPSGSGEIALKIAATYGLHMKFSEEGDNSDEEGRDADFEGVLSELVEDLD